MLNEWPELQSIAEAETNAARALIESKMEVDSEEPAVDPAPTEHADDAPKVDADSEEIPDAPTEHAANAPANMWDDAPTVSEGTTTTDDGAGDAPTETTSEEQCSNLRGHPAFSKANCASTEKDSSEETAQHRPTHTHAQTC